MSEQLLEKLAEIEHRQWMAWATSILASEELSKERVERWYREYLKPYDELSEVAKEHDRAWAIVVYALFKEEVAQLEARLEQRRRELDSMCVHAGKLEAENERFKYGLEQIANTRVFIGDFMKWAIEIAKQALGDREDVSVASSNGAEE